MKLFLSFFIVLSLLSCHKQPAISPSVDNLSTLAPPPMGALTYNDELKKELSILEQVLSGKIDVRANSMVKQLLMKGEAKNLVGKSDEAYLAKIYLALPELVLNASSLSPNRKLWAQGKLFFLRRRFIQAAMIMSKVVNAEPDFHEARNWRARAIFFLGNPDLAIKELKTIVTKTKTGSPESLDALYLIGAIIFESNDEEKKRIKVGIKAWQQYLAQAQPEKKLEQEINDGLKELTLRLEGKAVVQASKESLGPFAPSKKYSADKNSILRAFAKEELLLALELAEQYLRKQPDRDIELVKARIFIKSGRHDEAGELFAKITSANKLYAPGFHYQGMAFMLKGKIKEAVASWQETLKLDKDYAATYQLEQRILVAQKMISPQKIDMH